MRKGSYEFQVLVRGKPVTEYPHEGQIHIEGRRGSEFTLWFRNHTNNPVLVVPSVDAVSPLDGKTAGPNSPGIVVKPQDRLEIPGWMIDMNRTSRFEFQDRDRSYAESLDPTSTNVGVIGLMVFQEEQKQVPYIPPYIGPQPFEKPYYPYPQPIWNPLVGTQWINNPVTWSTSGITPTQANMAIGGTINLNNTAISASTEIPNSVLRSSSVEPEENLGVGWGRQIDHQMSHTTFDKGNLAETFVVYYDSRSNLKRKGIIVERRDTSHIVPNPFPSVGCTPPKGWKG